MIFLYVLSVLTIIQGVLTLLDGVRAATYIRSEGSISPEDHSLAVDLSIVVFCPCKGVDYEFEKNIRSILDQEFPRFSVCFIVESETDPAYTALRQIGASSILVAGPATDCGQKVHNLAYAVRQLRHAADIYVFCDSDARYPQQWLEKLTAPLRSGRADVSTGYRWYAVRRFHLPTLLRSAWNSSALGMLGDHGRNFAWGGSTAIRRDTFERIRVLDAWRGALSDDYAITRAAQAAGLRVRFVPACLIPSHGECTFAELLEFTTRQIIITRVYHSRLWSIGLVAQTTFNLAFYGLGIAVVWTRSPVCFVLWSTLFAVSAARSAVRIQAVKTILGDRARPRFRWFYVVSSPIVSILYEYNLICAALTRDIEWRQIRYRLISPNETLVRRPSCAARGDPAKANGPRKGYP